MRPPPQKLRRLGSGDALVLQHPDDDAAVLRLAFRGVVGSHYYIMTIWPGRQRRPGQ